ncbi:MAG: Trp biosynthesis-associated membrane protein [Cumulibacter sp.]
MTSADQERQELAHRSGPARARLMIILALLVLAGAALLWSSALMWSVIAVEREQPLPPLAYAISGSTAVPMVTAAGFIMLAAVVAVLATKTLGRRIIAVVAAVIAVITAVLIVQWQAMPADEHEASMIADGVRHAIDQAPLESTLAIPVAFVGLACALIAAVLLLVTRGMALMSSKYDRPSSAAGSRAKVVDDDPQARDRDLWKSLDRGEDPT